MTGDCHPLGHRFKFYLGETDGHCVYCGHLITMRQLDAYDNTAYILSGSG